MGDEILFRLRSLFRRRALERELDDELRDHIERQTELHIARGINPARNTTEFIKDFIDLGFKAVVTCVNAELLDRSYAGRLIDGEFLQSLPTGVDPCGENGEFHTFVFDGPLLSKPVRFRLGETVLRESFWFRDLVPE